MTPMGTANVGATTRRLDRGPQTRPVRHVVLCCRLHWLRRVGVGRFHPPAGRSIPGYGQQPDWLEYKPIPATVQTMAMSASTPVPISEAKTHLSELARRVRLQHERITLTRNGEPEAVLVSVDDLEGIEMTLEILGDSDAVARISESLAALGRGQRGVDLATVRADLARRRHGGA